MRERSREALGRDDAPNEELITTEQSAPESIGHGGWTSSAKLVTGSLLAYGGHVITFLSELAAAAATESEREDPSAPLHAPMMKVVAGAFERAARDIEKGMHRRGAKEVMQ